MFKLVGKFKALDWFFTFLLLSAIVGQVYFDVTLPEYTNNIITALQNPLVVDPKEVWNAGWPMIPYAVGSMVCTIIAGYFAALIGARFAATLRGDVFKKVQSFGFNEHNKFSTPSLITRSTDDIVKVQNAVILILRMGVSAPLTAVWAIIKINARSTELLTVTGLWIAFLVVALMVLVLAFLPKFRTVQKYTDKINMLARQNLTGLRVVKAYSASEYEEQKFGEVVSKASKLDRLLGRGTGLFFPIIFMVVNATMLSIYWVSAYLIDGSTVGLVGDSLVVEGALDVGTMMEFVNLSMQVLFSFMMLLMLFIMVPRSIISARRINEVLGTTPAVQDASTPKEFVASAEIEFKSVSFKYPGADEYVIKDISFDAHAGETVAFIGSTGSGKSTIVNLVPRFYDVTDGEILIGGTNIKDVKQSDLRSHIGYVPQKGVLFSGSVKENIAFGLSEEATAEMSKDANKAEGDSPVATLAYKFNGIEQAALVASAHSFVSEMDKGYDSDIAQGGKNVSGGQRQRLSIARAVAIDPKIFIFDDSFSALDYKTDKAVRAALKARGKGATNLIVAQRVGSIMDADKIIVLEQGQMVGMGTHDDLIHNCEVYKEIALSQLTASELGIA